MEERIIKDINNLLAQLFQKMKEAGYEWDYEKKELRKIENEIEIPFGAKDSELQEASYYIPEGFYAEIEGNRVVIKRGEQKPNPCDGCINRKGCINCENGELRETEHNPAFEIKTPEESLGIDSDTYNKIVDECIYGEQKPAWSEEDEAVLDALTRHLEGEDVYVSPHLAVKCLKSLKDRVQPQPRQEWNEEVEAAISLLKDIAEEQEKDYCPYNASNLRKAAQYLETCRPHNRWKPSDEQMMAIDTAINVLGKGTLNGKQLMGLQEQLKKLRGE